LATKNLKRHKSTGTDQIPAEMIKTGGRTIRYAIHKRIASFWNKEEFTEEWKESVIVVLISRAIKQIVVIIGAHNFRQLRTKFYAASCQCYFHMHRKLMGIINVDFDATYQLLIIYSAFVKYLRKNGNTTKQRISSL